MKTNEELNKNTAEAANQAVTELTVARDDRKLS